MSVGAGRTGSKSLLDILVGIEAGIIGGVAMLAWFSLTSPLLGQPWWLIPNLLANSFYNGRNVLVGPGFITCVGVSMQLAAAGAVGAMNGILTPGGRLFGLALAGAWYLLCYLFVWKRIAPGLYLYSLQPLIIVGYFLYGSVLGSHSHLLSRARR
jgi:hypothetical protein